MIRRYALAPQIGLEIEARGPAARHFAAEYGDGRPGQEPAVMRLAIGLRSDRALRAVDPMTLAFAGGHRFARWRVRVYLDAAASHVACALTVAGPLALTLVQSMVVEPLLSFVTPAAGRVLLPGALIEATDGPVLVLGASGTGKSTLALRALAASRPVAADDQLLLGAGGGCVGLPRRLRVYGDLPDVVPDAYARLAPDLRRRVVLAGVIARISGDRVSPPVPVRPTDVASGAPPAGRELVPVRTLLLSAGAERGRVCTDELVALAHDLLAEQRARLRAAGLPAPVAALEREAAILASGLGRLPAERVDVRTAADPLGALERAVAG